MGSAKTNARNYLIASTVAILARTSFAVVLSGPMTFKTKLAEQPVTIACAPFEVREPELKQEIYECKEFPDAYALLRTSDFSPDTEFINKTELNTYRGGSVSAVSKCHAVITGKDPIPVFTMYSYYRFSHDGKVDNYQFSPGGGTGSVSYDLGKHPTKGWYDGGEVSADSWYPGIGLILEALGLVHIDFEEDDISYHYLFMRVLRQNADADSIWFAPDQFIPRPRNPSRDEISSLIPALPWHGHPPKCYPASDWEHCARARFDARYGEKLKGDRPDLDCEAKRKAAGFSEKPDEEVPSEYSETSDDYEKKPSVPYDQNSDILVDGVAAQVFNRNWSSLQMVTFKILGKTTDEHFYRQLSIQIKNEDVIFREIDHGAIEIGIQNGHGNLELAEFPRYAKRPLTLKDLKFLNELIQRGNASSYEAEDETAQD